MQISYLRRAAALLVLISCQMTFAQTDGYRLLSKDGALQSSPEDLILEKPWPQILRQSPPEKFTLVNSTLIGLVSDFQQTLRKEPPEHLTSDQWQKLLNAKADRIQGMATVRPGSAISAVFKVANVSDEQTVNPQGFIVYGMFEWKTDYKYTREQRQEIADINKKYDADDKTAKQRYDDAIRNATSTRTGNGFVVSEINSTSANQAGENLKKDKADDQSKRKDEISKVKTDASGKVPCHMIYIYTTDDSVAKWSPGEVHRVNGLVQTVAAFHTTPDPPLETKDGTLERLEDCYVSMEFIVRGLEVDGKSKVQVPGAP